MKTLFERLKKEPFLKIESIKENYPYSYEKLNKELNVNFSIYQCSLDSVVMLNLFALNKTAFFDIIDITNLFED
jgi:hypothetical protein